MLELRRADDTERTHDVDREMPSWRLVYKSSSQIRLESPGNGCGYPVVPSLPTSEQ